MIIYKGFGFLNFVIIFGSSFAFNLASNAWWGEEYWKAHKWPFAVSLFLSAVLCWFVGRAVEKRAVRTETDKLTGEEVVVSERHDSFFFLPMSWWGPILVVIGAVVLVIDLTKAPEQGERAASPVAERAESSKAGR
ncbi:hypothetical protein DES53_11677 [Roseimicrobium gellanilyticum]|uniref:Uncharacterized protein n=1 Tax=Roseimicrobium gellanilyticum TaxID=748857 RepID=A0A366H5D7_9BACT|nr:hypothetical protein [Roseimicrobium gellanilyticum]RBP36638.1 hypothetical protein DES53_11677 [Roseimicrobium gellanilyticum]